MEWTLQIVNWLCHFENVVEFCSNYPKDDCPDYIKDDPEMFYSWASAIREKHNKKLNN